MAKFTSRDLLIKDFKFWRYLINVWSVLFFLVVAADFITNNACQDVINVLATLYIAILTIYVSDKEFERWYHRHRGQHPGELFVIVWTILIFFLVVSNFIFHKPYEIPGSVISAYIAVLTILAITRKSKELYQHKNKKNN
jgi:Na+/H+ antiporter NhaD/arsenite permease-like protein